jgi:hypothetical protein
LFSSRNRVICRICNLAKDADTLHNPWHIFGVFRVHTPGYFKLNFLFALFIFAFSSGVLYIRYTGIKISFFALETFKKTKSYENTFSVLYVMHIILNSCYFSTTIQSCSVIFGTGWPSGFSARLRVKVKFVVASSSPVPNIFVLLHPLGPAE